MGSPEMHGHSTNIMAIPPVLRWDDALSFIVHDGNPPIKGKCDTYTWSRLLEEGEHIAHSFDVAENILTGLVKSGKVRLFGLRKPFENDKEYKMFINNLMMVVPLSSNFFDGVAEIDVDGWCWMDEEENEITYIDIAVSWEDFIGHFSWYEDRAVKEPDNDCAEKAHYRPTMNAAPRGRGGRPPKYKWDEFYLELIRLANTPDGLPEKQADLERHMAEWCALAWGQEPAPSVIRSKLAPLYKRTEALPKTNFDEIGPADN